MNKTAEYIKKLLPGTMVDVHATVVNSDGTEGRGHDVYLGYFWTASEAKSYGKGKNTMGSNGTVNVCRVIVGADRQLYVIKDPIAVSVDAEKQKRVIAEEKLLRHMTPEELKLLGINL